MTTLIDILIHNVKLSTHVFMAFFDNSPGMKWVSHSDLGLLVLDDQRHWELWVLLLATRGFSSEKSTQMFVVRFHSKMTWVYWCELYSLCISDVTPCQVKSWLIFSLSLQVAPLEMSSFALHGVMQMSYGLVWCPLSIPVTSWIQVSVREHLSVVS